MVAMVITFIIKTAHTKMVIFTVHNIPLSKVYQNVLFSKATLFTCICFFFCVLSPLIVGYSTHGFWVKYEVHREKPVVHFKHQLLLVTHSQLSDSPVSWSTFPEYNLLTSNKQFISPRLTSVEYDDDNDGLMEGLELTLELDKPKNQTVQFLQMLLIFSFQLREISYVTMEAMGVLHYNSGMQLSELHYVGDLKWLQKEVLTYGKSDMRYNKTIVDQYEIFNILKNYQSRQYLTELEDDYYTPLFGFSDSLRIHVTVRYPEAAVEYAPGFWQTVKWAWIQYVSILVVALYLTRSVKDFVYKNQIVPTWSEKEFHHFHK